MEKKVLDHGFVRLVDYMPRENLDTSIVQAARVSYGEGTTTSRGDAGLIRYLMRHWHNTPFEMVRVQVSYQNAYIYCSSTHATQNGKCK
jgi:thymidylate synthase (FAD)